MKAEKKLLLFAEEEKTIAAARTIEQQKVMEGLIRKIMWDEPVADLVKFAKSNAMRLGVPAEELMNLAREKEKVLKPAQRKSISVGDRIEW